MYHFVDTLGPSRPSHVVYRTLHGYAVVHAGAPGRPRLLIEDEERTLDLFSDALRTAGYEVNGVTTATAALDALAHRHYHIVIADNILPDIQGVDLLAAMRGAMPTTPLILYSGDVTQSVREQAKDFGVYEVLEKPISLERLVGVVGKAAGTV